MKTILNKNDFVSIRNRLQAVDGSEKALWGKMVVEGMLCHIADQIRLATGEKICEFKGNFITKLLVKKLILLGMKAPKGKIETFPELKQGVGGTIPTSIEEDKEKVIELLNDVEKSFNETKVRMHPAFGNMNLDEWGKLIYMHMDHHLSQFGR